MPTIRKRASPWHGWPWRTAAVQARLLIDLVGYRRRGHNEGDEPAFTQPIMYDRIGKHPTVRARWATVLEGRGVVAAGEADAEFQRRLEAMQADRQKGADATPESSASVTDESARASAEAPETGVAVDTLRALSQALLRTPPDFEINGKIERVRARRPAAFGSADRPSIDWSMAES
jgi:2-oxoglutarate dehydrogenase E1 component